MEKVAETVQSPEIAPVVDVWLATVLAVLV
jgi:hypothetical protein